MMAKTNAMPAQTSGETTNITTKKVKVIDKQKRSLKTSRAHGIEKAFKDVLVTGSLVLVTVEKPIKEAKVELVKSFGHRINKRTDFDKQASNLVLGYVRKNCDMKGKHLDVQFVNDNDVIHVKPKEAA